jgi:septum formation protein
MSSLWRGAAPLLLASKSAARRAVLKAAGIPFESRDAMIDERVVEAPLRQAGAGAAAVARELARKKALAVSTREPGRLVLGADQTLALGDRLFSKPGDRAAARAQLAALQGETHELHSAICVARDDRVLFEAGPVARLTLRPLSADFIEAYLDAAGEVVLGSVGAYQIEGLGIHLVERIEGEHSVILGLPLPPLLAYLRAEGSLMG